MAVSMEGCAFVAWMLASLSAILLWAAWGLGYSDAIVPAMVYAGLEVALCIYVLALKYCG